MSSIFKPIGKLVKGVGKALGLVPDKPPPPPAQQPKVSEALSRQEERAEVAEKEALKRLTARKRARRTGGLRLLMSPQRLDEEQKSKLGGNTPKST
jgi:hypothetical protein